MKVFKDVHMKFQAECVSDIYMLRNLKVIVGGLQLYSASRAEVVEKMKTMMVSSSDVQFYPEDRMGLMHAIRKFKSLLL